MLFHSLPFSKLATHFQHRILPDDRLTTSTMTLKCDLRQCFTRKRNELALGAGAVDVYKKPNASTRSCGQIQVLICCICRPENPGAGTAFECQCGPRRYRTFFHSIETPNHGLLPSGTKPNDSLNVLLGYRCCFTLTFFLRIYLCLCLAVGSLLAHAHACSPNAREDAC